MDTIRPPCFFKASLFLFCIHFFLFSSVPGHAAQFRWHPSPEGQYESVGTIFADGPIEVGDGEKLLKALDGNEGQKGIPLYLELSSEGGSFDEAIRLSKIAQGKFLTTKLAARARCLSACAIIFMSGMRYTTSTFEKSREMHPTAVLGFHAPTVSIGGGKFDAADLEEAYSKAIDQVGKQLIDLARFRDHSWTNPMIKPALVNEMMSRRGNNFFFIDTVVKAAEFEIDLADAARPTRITTENRRNACQNAIAAFADSVVAGDAVKWWLATAHEVKLSKLEARRDGDSVDFESRPGTATYRFMVNRYRGQLCDVAQETDPSSDGNLIAGVDVSVNGDRIPVNVSDWFLWPSDKQLRSIPTQ